MSPDVERRCCAPTDVCSVIELAQRLSGRLDIRGTSSPGQLRFRHSLMTSVTSGLLLGPYLITQPIGAGGMGEVYRAHDTRLDRDVAVKVLPTEIAKDQDRRARFEREARAIAALTHPNVLAIHDVGTHDGIAYLVTELLDGETLRQRLADGGVAPRKAVEMGIQIASGLAAAHEKGIVHRDLKPENVFITRDGRVKILDFGLSAQLASHPGSADSPTIAGGTEPGVVLGTVGYMSPEQVRGTKVDHRTDIFALGAVLFEMLTGRRAFQRDTSAETMTAILKDDVPEISSTGRHVPPPIDRIVRRCLEKNPDERLQAVRDVAIALEAVSGTDVTPLPGPLVAPHRWWRPFAIGAALLVAGIGVGFVAAAMRKPAEKPLDLPRFKQLTFRRGDVRSARFAPDGQSIIYSARWDGEPVRVYPVHVERPRTVAAALADATLLAVSRTGDLAISILQRRDNLFLERGTLAQIPLIGGAPRELLENVTHADFASDGRLSVVRADRGRMRLEFPIGTVVYETTGWISSQRISPDGKRIAFLEHPLHDDDRGWPAVVDVTTSAKRNLLPEFGSISGIAWSSNGQDVCFASTNMIQCAGIDRAEVRVVVRGSQRLVLDDIASDGRMLVETYSPAARLATGEVGGRQVDLSWQDTAFPIDFSSDGSRLLFESMDYGINLRGLDGGTPIRLGDGIPAGFSPDGRSVLALAPGVPTTITIVPTGAGATRTLPRGPLEGHTWAAWMPDGQHIVIAASESGHGSRLYIQDTAGGEPRAFTSEGVRLMTYLPRVVSPDGHLVIAVGPDQQPALYPIAGGDPQPITALANDLMPIGWGETSDIIFARARALGRLVPLFKIDLTTGRRQPVGELGPADPTGAPLVFLIQISRDGRRYAYTTGQTLGMVFLIEGVKW
jgi:dipeptidyl aminopeptidase/acylaminoacyl peptidase